jgi:hypothetical protein
MNDKRIGGRTAFNAEDSVDCTEVSGVRAYPVYSFGRESHELTCTKELDGQQNIVLKIHRYVYL